MSEKKKILLIATGGTIASKSRTAGKTSDHAGRTDAVYPQASEIRAFHAIQLLNLDSSNMEPKHWKRMVHTIRENYDAYDGFVIAHGTDTMAYTAAALSYMIQNSPKPDRDHRGTKADSTLRLQMQNPICSTASGMQQTNGHRGSRLYLTEKLSRERGRRRCGPRATTHFRALIFLIWR